MNEMIAKKDLTKRTVRCSFIDKKGATDSHRRLALTVHYGLRTVTLHRAWRFFIGFLVFHVIVFVLEKKLAYMRDIIYNEGERERM